jgi:hypothetical protein
VQAHGQVVRVDDRAAADQHLVGAEREHRPARAGAAGHRRHDQLGRAADDQPADLVDGPDVAPRLGGRVGGGLDDVERDAVAEHVAAAQHQHRGVLAQRVPQGGRDPGALGRRHDAVVEVDGQRADRAGPPVGDLRVGRPAVVGQLERHPGQRPLAEHARRRQLDRRADLRAQVARLRLEVAEPHAVAVAGADQHRAVPAGRDRARPTGLGRHAEMRVVPADRPAA